MKKLLIPLFFIMFGFTGCESLSKMTQFDMEFTQSVTIPTSTIVVLPIDIATPDIETNSQSTFSAKKVDPKLIEKIALKKLQLNVTSPADGDFGFLKSIKIYITAEGLTEKKIAWLDDVPANAGLTLELNVSKTDLKEFILKDKFTLRVEATTDETHTSEYKIDVKTVFMVDAKILGL